MARSKHWGATSILAGVFYFFHFLSSIWFLFDALGWVFFSFFSVQENIETRSVLFTKGLEHITTTYRATTTEQTEQLENTGAASRYRYPSLYLFSHPLFWAFLHSVLLFALCCLIFWLLFSFFFSSFIQYHFDLHRGGLLGWPFCVFCYLFASHSLSSYIFLYQLHALKTLFLSFRQEEDQQACCM